MASGNKPQDHQLKNLQLDNQQTRKHNEIPPLKRTKKGLRKYGVKTSSPIQENTKEYNASYIKEFKEDIWWIKNCIDYFALRPEYHRDEIVRRLQHIEHLIHDLSGEFREDAGHLLLNKITPLTMLFMKDIKMTDLRRDVYQQLVSNLKELEKINGR